MVNDSTNGNNPPRTGSPGCQSLSKSKRTSVLDLAGERVQRAWKGI